MPVAHAAPRRRAVLAAGGLVLAGAMALLRARSASASPGVPARGYTLARVSDGISGSLPTGIGQLAFAPGDPAHVFATRGGAGVVTRYDYDAASGQLTHPVDVVTGLSNPIGLAFRDSTLYVSWNVAASPVGDGRLSRFRDLDRDGLFEDRADFVRGVPIFEHEVNQLQVRGTALYTTFGTLTNGGSPVNERVYTGTVVRIADLDAVDYSLGANALPDSLTFLDPAPMDGKVRRVAFGFRNPFGLRLDGAGGVWVTDNGASACLTCSARNRFPIDTPDFLYRDVHPGDKGQFPPPGYPGGGGATLAPLSTLSTHAAATGLDFVTVGTETGHVLVAEFGASDTALGVGRDVLDVDPADGTWIRLVTGFAGPTEIVRDPWGRFLIADYSPGAVYLLVPPGVLAVGAAPPGAAAIRLLGITPQPARSGVEVRFALGEPATLVLEVFDTLGRRIARQDLGARPAGGQAARWDGRDEAGAAVPAGVYQLRIGGSVGAIGARVVSLP